MRRFTSIVCSIAFAIFGITLAFQPDNAPTGYKTAGAAVLDYNMPVVDLRNLQLPKDLSLDLEKQKASDTVYITKTDTVQQKQVIKVKWRQAPAPDPIVLTDTVYVPKYYLATQVGNKEGPTDNCVSVYEVHKVDEICPENTNSSTNSPPYWKVDD